MSQPDDRSLEAHSAPVNPVLSAARHPSVRITALLGVIALGVMALLVPGTAHPANQPPPDLCTDCELPGGPHVITTIEDCQARGGTPWGTPFPCF